MKFEAGLRSEGGDCGRCGRPQSRPSGDAPQRLHGCNDRV